MFTIIVCGLATWLSRVLPFVLLKYWSLPAKIAEFLAFVPIVIMTTLWFSNLFTPHVGQLPTLNTNYLIASLPTVLAAMLSKNLLVLVMVGVVSLAFLRWL